MIILTALVMGIAYGTADGMISGAPSSEIKYEAWNPPMGKKESGESCKDGNCIGDICGISKDGKVYKAFRSVRDKLKEKCKF